MDGIVDMLTCKCAEMGTFSSVSASVASAVGLLVVMVSETSRVTGLTYRMDVDVHHDECKGVSPESGVTPCDWDRRVRYWRALNGCRQSNRNGRCI